MKSSRQDKRTEWSLRAKSSDYHRKLADAKRIIEKAIATAHFAISWSTGKDSTALAHLVRSIDPMNPIMIQFDDCDWPSKRAYADRIVTTMRWDVHEVRPDFSVWDMISKLDLRCDNICAQTNDVTRDSFLAILDAKRKDLGCDGVFMGLRMEESHARRMNLAKRGPLYKIKDGTWRCSPLWKWETIDVFAYLTVNDIEINPLYFNNRLFEPEDIRICWALPTPYGLTQGDLEHMRIYYPAQYARLRDIG